MSYDFALFRLLPGIDPRETVRADGEPEAGPRDPATEVLKRKVADALRACDPTLDEHVLDHDEIAKLHRMPVEEAYERFRYVELTDVAEGGSGAQITLLDDSVTVTIPYWHAGEAARTHLRRVWGYLDVMCRETGYEVFDPQLDRVIDAGAFEDALRCYQQTSARIRTAGGAPAARRAWWKFW